MKIVIAGAGEVGSHLAKMLSNEKHSIYVIDESEERLEKASEGADIITIQGSPTSISVLCEAEVQNADLFIAVSPAQEQDVNIVSALIAKKLGAKKVTARINNEEFQTNENRFIFSDMGIDSLFYPEKIASNEIVNLIKQSATSEFMDYSHGKIKMVSFRIEESAPILNKTMGDYYSGENLKFKIVAISREDETIIPKRDTKFKLGDVVFIVTIKSGVDEALALSGKEMISIRSLMILGGGRIGEMVASQLENSLESVKIIESRPERCEELSKKLNKSLILHGDGSNASVLIDEDVKECDAFVAVTGSSESNILSCVMAKKQGVPKVIAEVENFDYLKMAESMGVDAVINKKLITAGRIFRFTLSNKVRSIKVLSGTEAEVLEFIVPQNSKITKDKIGNLGFPSDALIGGYIRGKDSFIADVNTQIKPFDRVVVFAHPSVVSKVDKFFI